MVFLEVFLLVPGPGPWREKTLPISLPSSPPKFNLPGTLGRKLIGTPFPGTRNPGSPNPETREPGSPSPGTPEPGPSSPGTRDPTGGEPFLETGGLPHGSPHTHTCIKNLFCFSLDALTVPEAFICTIRILEKLSIHLNHPQHQNSISKTPLTDTSSFTS